MKKTILISSVVLLLTGLFLASCNAPEHCDAYPHSSSHSSFHKTKR